jgi:hypothetical protein
MFLLMFTLLSYDPREYVEYDGVLIPIHGPFVMINGIVGLVMLGILLSIPMVEWLRGRLKARKKTVERERYPLSSRFTNSDRNRWSVEDADASWARWN